VESRLGRLGSERLAEDDVDRGDRLGDPVVARGGRQRDLDDARRAAVDECRVGEHEDQEDGRDDGTDERDETTHQRGRRRASGTGRDGSTGLPGTAPILPTL
jgi:hypothetical protein